ncbi:patatin-like phospholipase family protein [Halanaerobacter jeridensis]|uniref:NTE family protein n=1 Tax=Halanaerobacter jeridensis TaxID=706427 RepID=A0A939BS54_9FIRM|nr:NTE family protein [Halanaerobacter jeridensis]
MKINLALSGGGIKGIAHLGGLKALEENNIEVVGIAGSSVGSIIASLYGAGYSCSILREMIYEQKFSEFKDGFILNLYRLIFRYGVYRGQSILEWLADKLADKGVETFSDLDIDVRIVVSNISSCCSKVFSPQTTPGYSVAKAVRMSLSIPVFYQPCFYEDHFCVDGGLINNLPLTVFEDQRYPTLGFLLLSSNLNAEQEIDNFLDYLGVVIDTSISINELRQIELSRSKVISIPTSEISSINFNLSLAEKKELYNRGYQQVYQDLDKFMDRRGVKSANKFINLSPTVVEIEEISALMIDYIIEKVQIEKITSIVALGDDDYLFSFLVAQRLNKKFTVINLSKYSITNSAVEYKYNQLNSESKVLIVNYALVENRILDKVITNLRAKEVEVVAVFNFFGPERKSNFHLNKLITPIYTYN